VALLEKRGFLYNHSGDFPQVILIIPSHVPNKPFRTLYRIMSYKDMSSILAEPIAPSYMSPDEGEGGVAGPQPMSTPVHKGPNKLWKSNSIFNLCTEYFKNSCLLMHGKPA